MSGDAAPGGRRELAVLQRAVRLGRLGHATPSDVLYRIYVTVLLSGFVFYLALGLVDDASVGPDEVAWLTGSAPGWVGLVAALLVAGGLRSGATGGPLAIDDPTLHHVVMSPVDRATVLRPRARLLLLWSGALGAIVGAAAGELASRRLEGSAAGWVGSGALGGAAIAIAATGSGLAVAGTVAVRRRPWIATLVASSVVAWAVVDVGLSTATAPTTLLGEVPLWPLRFTQPSALMLLGVVAVAVLGHQRIPRLSVERAAGRAHLVRQVRFALAQQDVRALIVLRRQLGQERPRHRPWIAPTLGPGGGLRGTVLRRDARSYLRWPIQRIVRVVALAVIAGLSLAATWRGSTAMSAVAAVASYVASLDVIEPFAQELDHPSVLEAVPGDTSQVLFEHLLAASVPMVVFELVALSVAAPVAASLDLLGVLGVAVLPAALAAVAAGALSIRRVTGDDVPSMMPDEIAGPRAVVRVAFPVVLAGLGALPVLAARAAVDAGRAPASSAASVAVTVMVAASIAFWWIRARDGVARSIAEASSQARGGTTT